MAKTVVITGSASGIGFSLAQEFFNRGYQVVISDLADEALCAGVEKIAKGDSERVAYSVCDVTKSEDLLTLWTFAVNRFSKVDVWINNAGIGGTQAPIANSNPAALCATINVNVNGVVLGTRVAINGMASQGEGKIYNTAGFGVDGFTRPNMTIYGTSKRAVGYFSKATAKELEGSGITLGWLNPGMVITPMIIQSAKNMSAKDWQTGRKVWNLFGESPEYAAQELVDRIEADTSNGTFIKLLTPLRMLRRLLINLIKPRDVMSQYGV